MRHATPNSKKRTPQKNPSYKMTPETIETPLTKRLRMTNPIFLAGMNVAAGPELCAAVSNAGNHQNIYYHVM
jgi:enoyl reductase-like protein